MNAPSIKQIEFIAKLKTEREVTPEVAALVPSTSAEASLLISNLLASPHLPKPQNGIWAEVQDRLALIPTGRYAVPAEDVQRLFPSATNVLSGNDHLFLKVYRYKQRLYMVRLYGSVGDFRTERIKPATQLALAALVRPRALELSQLFGTLFRVCGRCAAPLTDPESRRLSLGPDCRQVFGL